MARGSARPSGSEAAAEQRLLKAAAFGLHRISMSDEMSPVQFSRGGDLMIVMPVRVMPVRVEQRVGDSAKWHLAGVTSKTRISLRGNRVGEQVFYRVRATRGDKTSGSSNIATAYPDPSGLPRHRARAA